MQRIGTAGWSVPGKTKDEGPHLERYSRTLPCAEINSTFYRSHRASTWAKWAAATPAEFKFSIKAPRTITHEAKLHNTSGLLSDFFAQLESVREKMGPVLFQLPPSLAFESSSANDFITALRALYPGEVALEPRHASWFTPSVELILNTNNIARVAADPAKGAPQAAHPGGDTTLVYYRLHGSPRTYYSSYPEDFLLTLAALIRSSTNAWVIFDNTASAAAYSNALRLQQLISEP